MPSGWRGGSGRGEGGGSGRGAGLNTGRGAGLGVGRLDELGGGRAPEAPRRGARATMTAVTDSSNPDFTAAIHDFWRARRRANLREALTYLRGGDSGLLPYEEVRRKLRAIEGPTRELTEVPLDAIVGSVGRYRDFTREFLPRQNSDQRRWTGVRLAMTGMEGVPPVELYRIGGAYFVKDGNHRVSVARQLGSKLIHAYVTPLHVRVPLGPDVDPEELIIKAEYADFLEETQLDRLRPGVDLQVTVPGQYDRLLEHISVHRYFMGIDEDRPVPYREAVAHWYDAVYLPVAESIRRNGLLRGFEGRTETDLYLWLAEHRERLEGELGLSLPSATIASALGGAKLSAERRRELLAGESGGVGERLCQDVLVALRGVEAEFGALEQALVVARREGARLYGLVADEALGVGSERERLLALLTERCETEGVEAQFVTVTGSMTERLLERAAWTDLVVLGPPDAGGQRGRLPAEWRGFLRRCPRPVLVTTGEPSPLQRPLLAFDGSRRAEEALFVAAYFAAKWRVPLVVVTVAEGRAAAGATLERARGYLEPLGVRASYVEESGPVAERLVAAADAHACDSILMGSYKRSRWLEAMLGGVTDEVLLLAGRPVLAT